MGKAEGVGKLWHGHVTALTVAPEFRRMGLADRLMGILETVSEKMYVRCTRNRQIGASLMPHVFSYNAYFVDLFVRVSNSVAIGMYEKFGYSVYRRVLEYYSGDNPEDAFGMFLSLISPFCSHLSFVTDMRKALPRDVKKESIIPLPHPVRPEELEW